jgi:hypothetical protein
MEDTPPTRVEAKDADDGRPRRKRREGRRKEEGWVKGTSNRLQEKNTSTSRSEWSKAPNLVL